MNFRIEICADSIGSAINAQAAGAHRIELCSNLAEGGTTPSAGLIEMVRRKLAIKVNVLIRPRGGDFLYSDEEYEIMKSDILFCRKAGIDGVVSGILRDDGNIDSERTAMLVNLAKPMSFTFHRAFDLSAEPLRSLEDLIHCGAACLLTSGQKNSVPEGAGLIRDLVRSAGSRLIIMPGGGLNASNIAAIAVETGASEFHLSAGMKTGSKMTFRRAGISMGSISSYDEYSGRTADPAVIRSVIETLRRL